MKLIGNWFIILTAPIWFLPIFFSISIIVLCNERPQDQEWRDAITGKKWII